MAESVVSGVVVKLLEYMGKSAAEEIAPYFGGRHKLKELNKTMRMIQARLLDAERLCEGEDGALVKEWLTRLKHVLCLLEDLFEEVAVVDRLNGITHEGNKLTKTFRIILSGGNPVKNKKVAREAKAIMEELKAIAADMLGLNFRVHPLDEQRALVKLINNRKTHSYIVEEEVIGRDADKDVIVRMLLDSHEAGVGNASPVSVIPIVGIGGLGKTTLAQLAYNDKNVQQHFELKSWACILEIYSLEELVRKILKSITDDDYHHFSIEQLQSCLRESVYDKRYLLVLDDVWDEDRERWLHLRRLLFGGRQGSKIILTTRSRVVAQNMGAVEPYELGGLPEDKSWILFKSLAFRDGQANRNANLTSIGIEIVKKCANVPLAIRTVASLLFSKDTEEEWKNFKDSELRMIEQNENGIMSTLKLSYDHLPSHLKQCFAYCSLFPKDYEIDKQDLIYLWMAQGFITMSPNGNQSPEDIGHTYFMELLRRSFFQDIKRNEYDDIISCKMHNLMHDLAHHVAGREMLLVDGTTQLQIDNIWHCSFSVGLSSWEAPSWLLGAKRMRSLFFLSDSTILNVDEIFSSLRRLRALDLAKVNCESLPKSIGELKLLRYLKLGSYIESLPECITRLPSLHTLDHRRSYKIKELPRGFNKLFRLEHLHNGERLTDLPSGFMQLTSLRTLDVFIVGERNGLDALGGLNHLVGELKICYVKRRQKAVSEAMVANLKGKMLTNLFLTWSSSYEEPVGHADEEEDDLVLKWLQPPPSVKRLKVARWKGVRFPLWEIDEFPCSLPNLVSLSIRSCHKCQELPAFSRLPHLRFLRLWDLSALEYVEPRVKNREASSAVAYFPSLETLKLWDLPELKGWSRMEEDDTDEHLILARLSELGIESCPQLVSMPSAPKLESLEAYDINEKLLKQLLFAQDSPRSTLSILRELNIGSVHELVSLSINIFSLKSLTIAECEELISLMLEPPTSLRRLKIDQCSRLRDVSGALQHLSCLEELQIKDCQELDLWDNIEDEGGETDSSSNRAAWQGVKSLRSLKLGNIPKLVSLPTDLGCLTTLQELVIHGLDDMSALPEWIGHLTQLRRLEIVDCTKLSALPESFCNLTTLQKLEIQKCPDLQKRCACPDGEDWPLIQHIPQC